MTFETLTIIFPYAAILAAIGLIESLLTLRLVDELTETRGRGNKECIGQGVANTVTGMFGGMGGCAMIGQSVINVKSGGRTRLSTLVAGVFLLVGIVYTIQIVEKGNLEKARKRADLTDRCRRCAELSDGLPGQMMTPALKLLLTRIELALSERLRPLDKGNDKLGGRMQTLQAELAKGEAEHGH